MSAYQIIAKTMPDDALLTAIDQLTRFHTRVAMGDDSSRSTRTDDYLTAMACETAALALEAEVKRRARK